jgi:hypothetical protein
MNVVANPKCKHEAHGQNGKQNDYPPKASAPLCSPGRPHGYGNDRYGPNGTNDKAKRAWPNVRCEGKVDSRKRTDK